MKPGRRGTKRLLARYGERLVCVRYRLDQGTGRQFKAVELIVDDVGATRLAGPRVAKRVVSLRVERWELAVRQAVKRAGGKWNPVGRVWEIMVRPCGRARPRGSDRRRWKAIAVEPLRSTHVQTFRGSADVGAGARSIGLETSASTDVQTSQKSIDLETPGSRELETSSDLYI